MGIKVKPITVAAQKFVNRASAATGDYKDGVNSTTDQAERAIAAEDAYRQGLQESFSRNARVTGLQRAGTEKWKQRAMQLGAGRYASGVKAGERTYQENVRPYFETLQGLELTPRGPKGSPENYARSQEVGVALNEKKLDIQGGA